MKKFSARIGDPQQHSKQSRISVAQCDLFYSGEVFAFKIYQ